MMVRPLDREALRTRMRPVGAYAGDLGDSVVETQHRYRLHPHGHMDAGLLGQEIPDAGEAGVRKAAHRRVR